MEKKYIMTNITKEVDGRTLHRIVAIKSFAYFEDRDVNQGDLGGWIEKEENLSHEGDCWVYDEAMVMDNSYICESSKIEDNVIIKGNSVIRGEIIIANDVVIDGNIYIRTSGEISGNAKLFGNIKIYRGNDKNSKLYDKYDEIKINGRALLDGNIQIYGNVHICDNVKLMGDIWLDALYDYEEDIYRRIYIHGRSEVFGSVEICGDVEIADRAKVEGNVCIKGQVTICEDAYICGNCDQDIEILGSQISISGASSIYNSVMIEGGDICIKDNAIIKDVAKIFSSTEIGDDAVIGQNAQVQTVTLGREAYIMDKKDILCIKNVSKELSNVIFYRANNQNIYVKFYQFNNSINIFENKVRNSKMNNNKINLYLAAIQLAKEYFKI